MGVGVAGVSLALTVALALTVSRRRNSAPVLESVRIRVYPSATLALALVAARPTIAPASALVHRAAAGTAGAGVQDAKQGRERGRAREAALAVLRVAHGAEE